ncbi:hypothetical protein [Xanthomonas campestris]|uniref:hypothetical protein n=1 Tax=Xanthomonas campestris TaxID=339 RepID=UPI0026BA141D
MSAAALLTQLRDLELRLLDPQVRGSAAELETLLDPAFVEFVPRAGAIRAGRSSRH